MIIWFRISPWCLEAIIDDGTRFVCRVWLSSNGKSWKGSINGLILKSEYISQASARRAVLAADF